MENRRFDLDSVTVICFIATFISGCIYLGHIGSNQEIPSLLKITLGTSVNLWLLLLAVKMITTTNTTDWIDVVQAVAATVVIVIVVIYFNWLFWTFTIDDFALTGRFFI